MKKILTRMCAVQSKRTAFTLIELLVVIAIIGILSAMLLPALAGAKERGRRTGCLNNIRQYLLATYMYTDDNEQSLPSGASDSTTPDGALDDSVSVLSTAMRAEMIRYIGTYKMLGCPNMGAPFNTEQGWYEQGYGFVIGYNYLGGHLNTPWSLLPGSEPWWSPQKLTDTSTNVGPDSPLITDMNNWSPGFGASVVPHGKGGAVQTAGDYSNQSANGASSVELGSVGGNIGFLDGSVAWKSIGAMKLRRGSQKWGTDGCWAMW